jgi:hypothetical protein
MSQQGFANEDIIIDYLNNKKFKFLNSNWQKFLRSIFSNPKNNDKVLCSKKAGQNKSDIIITINKISKSISVKSGTGNSVHQEPVEEFIQFLKETYKINEELANNIRFFIWGDGTLNGKGKTKNRLSAPEFSRKYPQIIKNISEFFKENKKDLIERCVITGSKSKSSPDYIYYGDYTSGVWKKTEEVLSWLCEDSNESNGAIPVGRLTFQAWNRNINGGNKSEKKRGVIQLKWGTVGEDLKSIFSD